MNCKHYVCLLYGFIFTLMPLYGTKNSQIASMAPAKPAQKQVTLQQEHSEHLMKVEDFYASYTGFLSEEKEKEIRDILVEIGVQDVDSIRIKSLTDSLLKEFGVTNAGALHIPLIERTIYIGGGIAGIQTALDLADNGYDVVLVEKKPSIGGQMARLDKTFPTMDCSI